MDSGVSASEEGVCSGSFDSDGATSEKRPDCHIVVISEIIPVYFVVR